MASNFEIYVPDVTIDSTYAVTGAECQVLSIHMKPNDCIESEPGTMMMMSPSIKTEVRCGSCTRICTGETCCKTVYTNKGDTNGYIHTLLTSHTYIDIYITDLCH